MECPQQKEALNAFTTSFAPKEKGRAKVKSDAGQRIVRAIVLLNIDNYAGGRHPWGHPAPEYLEEKSFYEARPDDGLLEIFGLKHAWHASFVMAELRSAMHIAQAAAVKLSLTGGALKEAYMQMDGEPWKQPISKEHPTFVIIESTPFHSRIISGK
ncbi:DAGKa [Musa troglodytarum]|uniref:DAGKa n=1 Tax=Musa troglodytarum TaxID=320322 RepID=A0A9E7KC95_9LILI|nr:DAGKa [Musa troglodytarum]